MNKIGGAYMRPIKAENLNVLYSKYKDLSGKLKTRQYNDIGITPIGIIGDGFIVEKTNWILDDCNFVAEIKTDNNSSANIRNERVLYCGFMRFQWGHFLVNSMSRLWYVLLNQSEYFDKYIFSLPPEEKGILTGNYKDFFLELGILDKIEFINSTTYFHEVIVPDLSWSLQHHYSEEFNIVYDTICRNVATKYSNIKTSSYQKVFFTRSHLEKARLSEIGIEMLDDFFHKNGFAIISPETLSLRDMIYIMQNADIVAGASGTTVHNILFGRKGQKLIIAERNVINNDFQPGINLARNLDVTYIDSFLTVNSVNSGLGPFLYFFTPYMLKYAKANNYVLPEKYYLEDKYIKKCLRRYFHAWNKFYCRQWYFQKCAITEINSFYEAYTDSLTFTENYLKGIKPLCLSDYFSPLTFVKRHLRSSNPIYKFIKRCYLLFR